MSKEVVLLVTDKSNRHGDIMVKQLDALGAVVCRLNIADFPEKIRLEASSNGTIFQLPNNKVVSLEEVKSIWFYHPAKPIVSEVISKQFHEFAVGESDYAIYGALRLFDGLWVNHPDKIAAARYRLRQLQVANSVGFSIPEYLVTNDPKSAKAFYEHYSGDIITKIIGFPRINDNFFIFTNKVTPRSVENLDQVGLTPVYLQKNVQKKIEVRATVVGNRVFAAYIDSQNSEEGKTDWRKLNAESYSHKDFKLPDEVAQKCLEVVHSFGLHYSALDLILTPDDNYVFLEINPSGAWGWIEKQTGYPISEAIVRDLISAK